MSGQSKSIFIFILVILIGLLAGASIYLGFQMLKEEDEWDTSVADVDNWIVRGSLGDCTSTECTCHASGGCIVDVHVCDDGWDPNDLYRCYEFSYRAASLSNGQTYSLEDGVYNDLSCTYFQIDMHPPGAPSTDATYGAVTAEWKDWSLCEDMCPYDDTAARVKLDGDLSWAHGNLELGSCPRDIAVGAYHYDNGSQDATLATDVRIRVTGNGETQTVQNQSTFTATSGTYTVQVDTRNPNTNTYYSEEECKDQRTVTCPTISTSCGDGNCDTGENCEISGGASISCPDEEALNVTCRIDCTYCGDGIVNGDEECDPEDPVTGDNCGINCEIDDDDDDDENDNNDQIDELPSTAIVDETPWIIGIGSVLIGLVAFKLGGGYFLTLPLIHQFLTILSKIGIGSFERDKKLEKLEKIV